MNRYPIFLDLRGRRVLVVGGGQVATRRASRLVDCAAAVVVVSPTTTATLRALRDTGRLAWIPRRYESSDLEGADLVLACTRDPQVNAGVTVDAAARGIWCARADDAASSPVWVPATGTVDDVTVAISAGGDPRRAGGIRDAAVLALRSGALRTRHARRGGGDVVLVGGGPGDPDLLTLGGYRALLEADTVVTDRLGPTDLLALLPPDIEIIDVGKTPGGPAANQSHINDLLVDRARLGQRVVRLKGGDPFIFGRGAEEVDACLAAGVPVRVIPGVSSVTAAPGLAGIPLTHRGITQHFTVVSGHVPPGDPQSSVDWRAVAVSGGTIVAVMATQHRGAIADALIAGGLGSATPVAVVQNGSTPRQELLITTLDGLAGQAVHPPSVIVIGEVVRRARGESTP